MKVAGSALKRELLAELDLLSSARRIFAVCGDIQSASPFGPSKADPSGQLPPGQHCWATMGGTSVLKTPR